MESKKRCRCQKPSTICSFLSKFPTYRPRPLRSCADLFFSSSCHPPRTARWFLSRSAAILLNNSARSNRRRDSLASAWHSAMLRRRARRPEHRRQVKLVCGIVPGCPAIGFLQHIEQTNVRGVASERAAIVAKISLHRITRFEAF
jgi:hypothetical protein